MAATPPASLAPPARVPIDARLVQWFAAELVLDSRARLVEGGAGGDTRIDLAQVFVDLPAVAWCGRDPAPDQAQVVQSLCQKPMTGDDANPIAVVRRHNDNRMLSGALTKCAWCERHCEWKRQLDVEHYRPKAAVTHWEGRRAW